MVLLFCEFPRAAAHDLTRVALSLVYRIRARALAYGSGLFWAFSASFRGPCLLRLEVMRICSGGGRPRLRVSGSPALLLSLLVVSVSVSGAAAPLMRCRSSGHKDRGPAFAGPRLCCSKQRDIYKDQGKDQAQHVPRLLSAFWGCLSAGGRRSRHRLRPASIRRHDRRRKSSFRRTAARTGAAPRAVRIRWSPGGCAG